jgi:2-oxoglutarate ferredoxin oxidoreductase subunit alpha
MDDRKIPVEEQRSLIDGSLLMVEAAALAGVDSFVGYPITPANLLYLYSSRRFPLVLPATDEITTLQWMAGLSASGLMPMTATSYPGLALMVESIGMAFMMELPMLIILAQRLGPATGSATCNAQGDLYLIRGLNSGGYPIPTFCVSDMQDCWIITAKAVRTAQTLRTPVILLTSKEMAMTMKDFALDSLSPLEPSQRTLFEGPGEYVPYAARQHSEGRQSPNGSLLPTGIPDFLPVGNPSHRVRLTASTHDAKGNLQHSTPEALANTLRLGDKIVENLPLYTEYEYIQGHSRILIIAFDVTAEAARDSLSILEARGIFPSLLVPKTLFPVPRIYLDIAAKYEKIFVVEENHDGQYRKILFGELGREGIRGIHAIGRMISPEDIVQELLK